jgi:putative ABC transport system permease protein
VTRRFVPARLPFTVRQGLANLHRPDNRTLLLLLALGLGTFLMVSLYLVQQTLLTQLVSSGGTNQPNAILFDIQPDQKEAVSNLVTSLKLPVLDQAPIVTMRLTSVKGRAVESILADKQSPFPTGRCVANTAAPTTMASGMAKTYRRHMARAVTNDTHVVPISVEEGMQRMQVGLGDEIVFDVQGVPLTTRVASLREVDWRRIQPNFSWSSHAASWKARRPCTSWSPVCHRATNPPDCSARWSEISERLSHRSDARPPNARLDSRQDLVCDPLYGDVHGADRFVGAGGRAAYRPLPTPPGKHPVADAGRLARTNLPHPRGRIFSLGLLAALTGILLALTAAWALSVFLFR